MDSPLIGNPRFKSLDVWRGLACLIVVFDHASVALSPDEAYEVGGLESWLRWVLASWRFLHLGPPMFFVISGYCIAASVDSMRRKQQGAFPFLLKRLWRTYLPYWFALFGFIAVVGLLDVLDLEGWHQGPYGLELVSPGKVTPLQWLGNLTLTETWRPLIGGPSETVFTRVAWSLCYQEQFYFLCFAVVLIAPRRLYSTMAIVTAAVLFFRVFVWDAGALHRIDGTFPNLWHEFAVGLAVYWRLNVAATARARRLVELGLVALGVLACFHLFETTISAALTGLALIAIRPWDDRLGSIAWLGPIKACGKRCYSVYLVHLPIVSIGNMMLHDFGLESFWARALVMIPVVCAAALAVSWAFYHVVESRFLDLPRLRSAAARPVVAVPRSAAVGA